VWCVYVCVFVCVWCVCVCVVWCGVCVYVWCGVCVCGMWVCVYVCVMCVPVCLILCALETSTIMGLRPHLGCSKTKKLHRVEDERNILHVKG
jgi:hypothetical protein